MVVSADKKSAAIISGPWIKDEVSHHTDANIYQELENIAGKENSSIQ
jgi:hypothetical protein